MAQINYPDYRMFQQAPHPLFQALNAGSQDIGKFSRGEIDRTRSIQDAIMMEKLKNQSAIELAKAKQNLEQALIQKRIEMFQGGQDPMQQVMQEDPRWAMSLPDGGVGDVQGNRLSQTQQPTNRFGKFHAPEGYALNPNFMFGAESSPFVKDPDSLTPNQQRLGKQQQANISTRIRQEFINRPEVKDYITVSTNVKSMDSLLSKAISGGKQNQVALDQALITMYNKLTDPQSVVRESEYARTPGNLPIVNRFYGAIEKLSAGGAGLTNDDRKALVWGAKVIANERGATYNSTLMDYKQLANDSGIDQNLIIRGLPEHKDFSPELGQAVATTPKKTKSGNTYQKVE